MRPYCAEPFTLPADGSEDALREHVARTTFPIYHPVGTCAIGTVVYEELAVMGLDGLRVVDASVMPLKWWPSNWWSREAELRRRKRIRRVTRPRRRRSRNRLNPKID